MRRRVVGTALPVLMLVSMKVRYSGIPPTLGSAKRDK